MKKTIFAVILASVMIGLTACGGSASGGGQSRTSGSSPASEASAPPESGSLESASPAVVDDDYIREIVVNFGAQERDGVLNPQTVSLFYADSWKIETAVPGDFFSWYMGYMWREDITYEQALEKYKNPLGEDMGWFFPAEIYESVVTEYFDVTADFLRSDEMFYNAEHNGYTVGTGGGRGATPVLTVNSWREEGDLLVISLNSFVQGVEDRDMLLTVSISDGGYKYLSYLPAGR